MTITLSTIAHTAIDQMFRGLDGLLDKGAADAKARGVEEAVYLNTRLAADMFPLTRQVQIATEFPARTLARLTGIEPPDFTDDETTFSALQDRIVKARTFIKGLPEQAIDADPNGAITFPAGPDREMTMPRVNYLQNMILPNVYFHTSMTYAILRHLGVEIGKFDFLAPPQ